MVTYLNHLTRTQSHANIRAVFPSESARFFGTPASSKERTILVRFRRALSASSAAAKLAALLLSETSEINTNLVCSFGALASVYEYIPLP